jgi:hypothetical protein
VIARGGALHRFILETLAETGRSPSLEDIRERFELPSTQAAEDVVVQLERAGSIHRNPGDPQITHAYPFSNEPTPHRVSIAGGPEVFAMCAIDALGMPFMLKRDGDVRSSCEGCGADVRISIEGQRVTSAKPAEMRVWFGKIGEGCVAATDLCPDLNLFCSQEHVDDWRAAHHGKDGEVLTLDEAVEGGRRSFETMLDKTVEAQ